MKFTSVVLAVMTFFIDVAVFGFVISSDPIIRFGFIGFIFTSFVVLIIAWRQARKRGYQLRINGRSIWNFLVSLRKYLKINYQTIAIASIGIIIGTTAFGQALILSDLTVNSFVRDQLNTNKVDFIKVTMDTSVNKFVNDPNLAQKNIDNNITNIIGNRGYSISNELWLAYFNGVMGYYTYNGGEKEPIYTIIFYSHELMNYGHLTGSSPEAGNEFVLISSGHGVIKSDRNIVYFTEDDSFQKVLANGSITGYFQVDDDAKLNYMDGLGIPIELKDEFLSYFQDEGVDFQFGSISIEIKYYTGDENKVVNDLTQTSRDLQYIMDDIDNYLANTLLFVSKIKSYFVSSTLYQLIQSLDNMIAFFKALVISLSLPILVLTGFIISFTSNLLENHRKKVMFMLKQRGANEMHLLGTSLLELIAITLFSGTIGGLLAIPVGAFFASSIDLLAFSWKDFRLPFVHPQLFLSSIAIAFALTITFNLNHAIQISQISYLEASDPESSKKSFITRHNLDLFSLIIGILYAFIIYFLRSTELIFYIGFLLVMFLPVGFFGLTIGSVMLFTRSFEKIMIVFSKSLWKKTGRLPAFALRNLALRKRLATKVIGLFMIGFIFFMFFTTLPTTLTTYEQDSQLYHNYGTNIAIHEINYTMAVNIQRELNGNPNVTSTTLVYSKTFTENQYYDPYNDYYSNSLSFTMLAVDPNTYFNTVNFYSDYFDENPVTRIFTSPNKLKEKLQTPSAALVYKNNEYNEESTLEIPQKLLNTTYSFLNQSIQGDKTFIVKGFFEYWPGLITYSTRYLDPLMNVFFVTSIQSLKSQLNITSRLDTGWSLLVKVPDNDVNKADSVATSLLNKYNNIDVSTWKNEELSRDPELLVVYSILNSNIIFAIVTGLLGILIFNYVTLTERKRELSLLKSLGMVRKQIINMLLVEITFLAVIGVLMGLIMGWLTSVMFIGLFYMGGSEVPPMRIVFMKEYNTLFSVLAVLLSLISSIIPAIKISREKPGTLLRVD